MPRITEDAQERNDRIERQLSIDEEREPSAFQPWPRPRRNLSLIARMAMPASERTDIGEG
jgi:hypothetical protein